MNTRNHIQLFLICCLAALVYACNSKGNSSPESETQEAASPDRIEVSRTQFTANNMKLGSISQRTFPGILRVSGTIDVPPENRAVVSAIKGGFVRQITLLVGDRVRKGQRIALLESPEFLKLQQEYLEIQAQLPFLEADYKRLKILFDEKITSEKAYLQAESAYKIALAQNAGLKRQLELLHIRPPETADVALSSLSPVKSPIDGAITRVNVRKGAYVSQASEIVEIVNREHLHLELQVYEKDVNRLEKGQLIRFMAPELSDEVYEAEVYLIATAIDENRTVQVHAHLDEVHQDDFLVGMFIRADILMNKEADGASFWAVPEEAVAAIDSQSYILLLESENEQGYIFRKVPVTPGRSAEGFTSIEIAPDVPANAQILSRGVFSLVGGP